MRIGKSFKKIKIFQKNYLYYLKIKDSIKYYKLIIFYYFLSCTFYKIEL